MQDIEYAAPSTIEEAVRLLALANGDARVLAGGTDLLVQLREHQRAAGRLVDVKRIPELMRVEHSADRGLVLGAAVPCYRISEHPGIERTHAGLVDATRIIGAWQIQSRASLGGNLCNSSPAADSIPPLVVYGAVCRLAGPAGRRSVPAGTFCTGPGRNVLGPGELLVAIAVPPQPPRSGCQYQRFIPRNEMDIAVVGAASWVQLDPSGQRIESARIALGAVAPTPVEAVEAGAWLAGRPVNPQTFSQAGQLARKAASPISDLRAPADYRLHLVGVLVERTLAGAVERARATFATA